MQQIVGPLLVPIPLADEVDHHGHRHDAGRDQVEGGVSGGIVQRVDRIDPVRDRERVHDGEQEQAEPHEPSREADRQQSTERDVQAEDHEQPGRKESSEHRSVDYRASNDDDEHHVQDRHVARRADRDDAEQEDGDREGHQVDDPDPRVARVEPRDHRRDAEQGREDERQHENPTAAAPALGLAWRRSDRQDALEEALQDRRPRHPRNLLRR